MSDPVLIIHVGPHAVESRHVVSKSQVSRSQQPRTGRELWVVQVLDVAQVILRR